jgi:hypothetical protein
MPLELLKTDRMIDGLTQLMYSANSMGDNMRARIETPTLPDGTDLWSATWLDSKDMAVYGGIVPDTGSRPQRTRFKIDQTFDLGRLVNAQIGSDGSIAINPQLYDQSTGTEFIVLAKNDVPGKTRYAVRADKFEQVRKVLDERGDARGEDSIYRRQGFSADDAKKLGAFALKEWLSPNEIIDYNQRKRIENLKMSDIRYVHDGWLEHAKGAFSDRDELKAAQLLARYVKKAAEKNCFPDGKGMGFFAQPDEQRYNIRPWCVYLSNGRSRAVDWNDLDGGRFLRVGVVEGARERSDSAAPEKAHSARSPEDILREIRSHPEYQVLKRQVAELERLRDTAQTTYQDQAKAIRTLIGQGKLDEAYLLASQAAGVRGEEAKRPLQTELNGNKLTPAQQEALDDIATRFKMLELD